MSSAPSIDMNGDPQCQWSRLEHLLDATQYFYGTEIGYRWRRPNGEFDHLHLDLFYADQRSTRLPDTTPNKAGGGFRVYGEKQMGPWVGFGGYTYNTAQGGGISATFARADCHSRVGLSEPVLGIRGEAAIGLDVVAAVRQHPPRDRAARPIRV